MYLQADTDLRIFIEKEHLRDYFKYYVCISKKIFCLKCLRVFVFFCSEGLQFTKCVLKTKKNKKKAAEGEMYTFVLVFTLYIPVNVSSRCLFTRKFSMMDGCAPSLFEV